MDVDNVIAAEVPLYLACCVRAFADARVNYHVLGVVGSQGDETI